VDDSRNCTLAILVASWGEKGKTKEEERKDKRNVRVGYSVLYPH
jgi:hypothetical protein